VFGFNGNRPYRQPGQADDTVMVQDTTNRTANDSGGILGFFASMFSGSSRSSSGYLQPMTSPQEDAVICQPVEGIACQPMEATVCQPVEGVACQPVTMVQGPFQGS
jgi:hypothetical protein